MSSSPFDAIAATARLCTRLSASTSDTLSFVPTSGVAVILGGGIDTVQRFLILQPLKIGESCLNEVQKPENNRSMLRAEVQEQTTKYQVEIKILSLSQSARDPLQIIMPGRSGKTPVEIQYVDHVFV